MDKNKKKLLCWCDFNVPTGFSNVAMNLLDDMHEEYDVSIIAINYHGDTKYDTSKYFCYSVSRDDMIGIKRMPKVIHEVRPDILFLFQDIFHISDLIERLKKEALKNTDTKVVAYFPVDGSPFSVAWGNVFGNVIDGGKDLGMPYVDTIITYSDWAIETIKERFPNVNRPIHKLCHGVNLDTFYLLEQNEILALRKEYNWENKFVAVNVNRFQPRKAIPLSARAFSMFAKGYKVCKCGNHMPINRKKCDLNMCSEEDIIHVEKRDRKDVFYYLHMMPQEPTMGPGRANLLQNHLLNAGFVDKDVPDSEHSGIIGINARNIYAGHVSASEVNKIYNASNVNISSTLGEGCGLSFLEAAASGTPSIAPRNSAVPEMLRDTGHLLLNDALMNQAMDNAHLRPMMGCWEMVKALDIEYERWKANANGGKEIRQECIDNINEHFLWEDKRQLLKKIFRETLNEK